MKYILLSLLLVGCTTKATEPVIQTVPLQNSQVADYIVKELGNRHGAYWNGKRLYIYLSPNGLPPQDLEEAVFKALKRIKREDMEVEFESIPTANENLKKQIKELEEAIKKLENFRQ